MFKIYQQEFVLRLSCMRTSTYSFRTRPWCEHQYKITAM